MPLVRERLRTPIGQFALHRDLDLSVPPPVVQSFVVTGARRTRETPTHSEEEYPKHFANDGTPLAHLRFALKNEPLDLRVLNAALEKLGDSALEDWVKAEPTSVFSRQAWFFRETFTGRRLNLEDAGRGPYVDALDPGRHFVLPSAHTSTRHRVRNNLLGDGDLCVILRRTPKLVGYTTQAQLSARIADLVARYDPQTLARAVNHLYAKETRSSFAIEGETPSPKREARFLQALQNAASFTPDKALLLELQNAIVDSRYAATDFRAFQNLVGDTTRNFEKRVVYVCPRPEDVASLMRGWEALTHLLTSAPGINGETLDAPLAAAVSAFAFVFIHPFEDGNGRIHRFLIHSLLAKRGFSPPGMLFPVSAAILRQRHLYDAVLEAFSRPVMAAIDWRLDASGEVAVTPPTRDLYRFFDATAQAEYLYDRIAEAIDVDFAEELAFLDVYDRARAAVQEIVDMPDRRLSLLLQICLRNGGRMSHNKRDQFAEVTDAEIEQIENELAHVTKRDSGALTT